MGEAVVIAVIGFAPFWLAASLAGMRAVSSLWSSEKE